MYTFFSSISSFLHLNSHLGFVHITKALTQVQITCVNTPFLKFWGILKLPIPKVVTHSRSFGNVFFHFLDVFKPFSCFSLFPTHFLPCLNFGHEPKAKVMKRKKYTHTKLRKFNQNYLLVTPKNHTHIVFTQQFPKHRLKVVEKEWGAQIIPISFKPKGFPHPFLEIWFFFLNIIH